MAVPATPPDMTAQPGPPRRWTLRIIAALIILAGLGIAAAVVADQIRLRLQLADCRDPSPEVRIKALTKFAQERDPRASRVLPEILEKETDPAVLEIAGYTAMRIKDTNLLDVLQRRASQGPDDSVRAKLILYAARLSNRDVRLIPWLEAGVQADGEPWRQAASAAGLLQVGEPRGGLALIALARRPDAPARTLARNELDALVGPMTETVGWPITWPAADQEPDAEFWASLNTFWEQYGTARLLDDVLTRRFSWDPRVYELNRLIHARQKVAQLFD